MPTNVPAPSFTPTGFVAPTEAAILAGVQADQNAAFGGNLNPGLSEPQGQLAQSMAAIIGDANNQFLALAAGVDPAFSSGRMQDAIGRLYFMTRIVAAPTVVTATCTGAAGTIIPANAQAVDQAGNVYLCTAGGTIPVGGSIDLTFENSKTGPIACPVGYLNAIYQAIPGWDTINNSTAGVLGNDVESQADFEFRRQNTVAANAQGINSSVLGAVLNVPGVLDAYVISNDSSNTSGAVVQGYISGTTLTVTSLTSGVPAVNDMLVGAGITAGTYITALGTANSGTGWLGTYQINISQTVASSGAPEAITIAFGGLQLGPNCLYVAAYGGNAADIAQAIWTKKMPGCSYYAGNTSYTVTDMSSGYNMPYPTYVVTFNVPTATPVKFAVSMQSNPSVPANAVALVQAAVLASFNGQDGGPRARIGSALFASRFYANIAALGSWARIYSIQLGITTANQNAVILRIDQVPTLAISDISVTFT